MLSWFYQVKLHWRQGAIFKLVTPIVIFIRKEHCPFSTGSGIQVSGLNPQRTGGRGQSRTGNSSLPFRLNISPLETPSFLRRQNGPNLKLEPPPLTLSDIYIKNTHRRIAPSVTASPMTSSLLYSGRVVFDLSVYFNDVSFGTLNENFVSHVHICVWVGWGFPSIQPHKPHDANDFLITPTYLA